MKAGQGAVSPAQWAAFTRKYRAEMAAPEARHDLELLAVALEAQAGEGLAPAEDPLPLPALREADHPARVHHLAVAADQLGQASEPGDVTAQPTQHEQLARLRLG